MNGLSPRSEDYTGEIVYMPYGSLLFHACLWHLPLKCQEPIRMCEIFKRGRTFMSRIVSGSPLRDCVPNLVSS